MPGTVQQNGRWDRRQDWAGVTRHCTNHRAHGLTPMPHYAANSCTEDNAAWGATSGLLWPRNQYPGAIIPSKASAACSRGSTARGPMSAKAPRDGLASAPTEPQPPTTSSRDDLHVPRTGQGLPVTMLSTVHMVDTDAKRIASFKRGLMRTGPIFREVAGKFDLWRSRRWRSGFKSDAIRTLQPLHHCSVGYQPSTT